MKEKILVLLIFGLMLMTATPVIFAGNVDNVTVTLSPQATASISVDQSSWTPDAGLGESESTAGDWATLTNNGPVQVDVTIKANNTNDWILANSAGHNQFSLFSLINGNLQDYEQYTGSKDGYDWVMNDPTLKMVGQTFTVGTVGNNEDFYVTNISAYVYHYSGTPQTLYCDIRTVSGNLPTTNVLGRASKIAGGSFQTFNFNPPVHLNAGGTYCFVFWMETETMSEKVYYDSTSPSYSGGHYIRTLDGEDSWTAYTGRDFYKFTISGYNASEIQLTTSPASFVDNLSPVSGNNTQNFGLRIQMPTTSSTTQNQQTEITFTATAD